MHSRGARSGAIALLATLHVLAISVQAVAQEVDRVEAKGLIDEAQGRYGRLPLGGLSDEFFEEYGALYGFGAGSYADLCADLVATSLSSASSSEALLAEFERSFHFRDGLLGVYGDLAGKWGLTGDMSAAAIAGTVTDPAELTLFKTALLADSAATVWSFVLGYQYFRLYTQSPPQPTSDTTALTQTLVNARLRDLAGQLAR
jgi:hypothetical protein